MPVVTLGPQDVVTVQPDDTVGEAVDRLESEPVGALVVTEDRQPVGLRTERDAALAAGDGGELDTKSVESLMTADPVTIHENEEAVAIARTIGEAHVRRIPIVDDDGALVGIATLEDLVAAIGGKLENVADTIEAQSPDYQP